MNRACKKSFGSGGALQVLTRGLLRGFMHQEFIAFNLYGHQGNYQ